MQLRSNAGANRHAALQTRARVTRAAAAAAGELRDRQDVAHAASLGGLQLGGWRLGHHLANIQLEIIAPTLLFRRGGHVRDRRGRRRGQTLLEFECAAASPARAPIRAPRRATTTSSSRAKHHHERAGAADALGGTATLREFFAGRRAARTWRMRIDAPSNFPRRPRASHQVPGGMVLWSTSYRPLIGSHTKNDPSRIGSEALDFASAPPAPTTRVRIRRERGVSTKKRELSLPLPTPLNLALSWR